MTELGQVINFQIRVDATAQANQPQSYNLKVPSGGYRLRLTNIDNVMSTGANVEFQLNSSQLANSYGTEPFFLYQQYEASYTPTSFLTNYDFGEIQLNQRLDLWIVDRATGLPHSDFQSAILTFEAERVN